MLREFRRRLWQPPRPHGEIIEDRSVSFLELFYDLVYVVVIARAAHHLAQHLDWRGVFDFAVVFSMIWLAWTNGTFYHEVHGRNDVRSRVFIFAQMIVLALLALYTGDAGGDGGTGFALIYSVFLVLMIWMWGTVWLADPPERRRAPARYVLMLTVSLVVMLASTTVSDDARIAVWALYVLGWTLFVFWQAAAFRDFDFAVTESMVERFGLFTIIVLGEVVVGVVDGLSEVNRAFTTVATGIIALLIGFGYWWTYFDFVSRRAPKVEARHFYRWIMLHLPATAAIAAAGAAMVSLVAHATEPETPAATATVLTLATAVGFLAIAAMVPTLEVFEDRRRIYGPLIAVLIGAAALSVVIGVVRPRPLVLAISVAVLPMFVWITTITRWLQTAEE